MLVLDSDQYNQLNNGLYQQKVDVKALRQSYSTNQMQVTSCITFLLIIIMEDLYCAFYKEGFAQMRITNFICKI